MSAQSSRRRGRATKALPKSVQPRRLNAADLRRYELDSNAKFDERREKSVSKRGLTALAAPPRQIIAVAEGDSWFDYKPAYYLGGRDLLGHLQATGRINVFRVSKAGDTIENMVYGTDYDKGDFTAKPSQLGKTLEAIRKHDADVFLFSGGGNDLAGAELEGYINHKVAGIGDLRHNYVDFVFDQYLKLGIQTLITQVRALKPDLPIFLHGYDYAIPDGRPVIRVAGWSFVGPWLRPALTKKRYVEDADRRRLIAGLIDRLNAMLKSVAATNSNVFYISVLGTLRSGPDYKQDWANELHPTSSGFKKVAEVFEREILAHI